MNSRFFSLVNDQICLIILNFFSDLHSDKMIEGEFFMKKSVLLGFVILSSQTILAQNTTPIPTIKLSSDSENYFKNSVLKSCKKYRKNDFYVDYRIESDEKVTKGLIEILQYIYILNQSVNIKSGKKYQLTELLV